AGSHGKDTRGIFRVHQFDKVEMFSYVTPEESQAEHQRLLEWEKQWLTSLELPFRVIDVASADLGSSAARKYDCEAWIPTQGKYRELTSTSDCTEFQSRRLQIRVREDKKVRPLATLNGTLCAVPRTIVAILENHQQADGSVRVPEVLRPDLGGRELREPVAKRVPQHRPSRTGSSPPPSTARCCVTTTRCRSAPGTHSPPPPRRVPPTSSSPGARSPGPG